MKITVLYVGSSLLAPLRNAERELARRYALDLQVAAHNLGGTFADEEWATIESDLSTSEVVFVIHVMDGENATRLLPLLDRGEQRATIVFNCMPELMRRTRMGKLDLSAILGNRASNGDGANGERRKRGKGTRRAIQTLRLLGSAGSWMGNQARAYRSKNESPKNGSKKNGHGQYLKLVDRLPGLLRFVPSAGKLRDAKNYLYLFCYFLQPTPQNIRMMLLFALKQYVPDPRLNNLQVEPPETMPSVAIYHPDAAALFPSFAEYRKWYAKGRPKSKVQSPRSAALTLEPASTIGLLLMRPQIVSNTRKHYDGLIRAIEAEGLSVIPAISTLMDNREACGKFFLDNGPRTMDDKHVRSGVDDGPSSMVHGPTRKSRISQLVSLTGFSFVGGPAMNDSEAATEYLRELNVPFRSAVSLDLQTIESWRASGTGLNPVQSGMQIAIPEIDGATEPFVYGGMPADSFEPVPLDDRCRRFARRLKNWNHLQTANRADLKLALVIYCFPANKGNMGTAADLEVFESVHSTLQELQAEGYTVDVPENPTTLRNLMLGNDSDEPGATANVAYRMSSGEYARLCPYAAEIEKEWGPAPGKIDSSGNDLLIQGINCGNVFIGLQPTFGYEGDPMRMLMAKSGAPHHGFMAFYTYLQSVFQADAVVHVGTHGAMEFMPGKQVGMSGECWPDRLIGELPNLYIYSVNNPSEGTIAKRRSYAELISYLTPPIESAGLYKGMVSLKEMIMSYRETNDEQDRERLFESIQECSRGLNFNLGAT
ncbi:MAG: magnesium chelatase subunit [Blastocatellia bacterium]|jgi:magnesium chelatase subunit H|nr:magnesium chelatase subunit [Blastocatellia bacterium]